MSTAALHRAVRLTARGSGLLFAGAQATFALGPRAERASQPLYLAFLAAHAAHFVAVSRYAKATGGRALFPGGRDLDQVGGWPTVLGIYAVFAALALTGQAAVSSLAAHRPRLGLAGRLATGLIGAMFAGTYLGQLARSRWFVVPAAIIGTSVAANVLASGRASAGRGDLGARLSTAARVRRTWESVGRFWSRARRRAAERLRR